MKKRILSLILALTMILGMIPSFAMEASMPNIDMESSIEEEADIVEAEDLEIKDSVEEETEELEESEETEETEETEEEKIEEDQNEENKEEENENQDDEIGEKEEAKEAEKEFTNQINIDNHNKSKQGLSDLDNIINGFKTHYKNNVEEYNYLESMTLKSLEVKEEAIQEKLKIEGLSNDSSSKEYAKVIMGIIGAGLDPTDYNGKDYISILVGAQTDDGYFETKKDSGDKAEEIAYSIMALDMAGAEYDVYKAVKLLESKFTIEENKAFIKKWSFHTEGDLDLTSISLIAISNHDYIVDNNLINKIVNYIESKRFNSGMYGDTDWYGKEIVSGKLTSKIVQALITVEQEIPVETIYGLLELQENNEFKESSDETYGYSTSEVLAALVDVYTEKSMFKDIASDIGEPTRVEVLLTGDSNTLKIGKKMQLLGKAYDENNKYNSTVEYIWSSNNTDIITVDNNTGMVEAISSGTANITVEVKGFENVKKSIEIEVIDVEPYSIDIETVEGLFDLEVDKKTAISATVLDEENVIIENPDIKWEIWPEESGELDDFQVFTALKSGEVKITASIKKSNDEILRSSLDLRIISRETKINEALEEIKNGLIVNDDKYDHTTAMALSLMGISGVDISSKAKEYSKYSSNSNTRAKDIMMAIVLGKDPREYNGRNYVQELLDNNFYTETNSEWLSNSIIALDMAEEDYDEKKAIDSLISKFTQSAGKFWIKNSNGNPDNVKTALALVALLKHEDLDRVTETIEGIKKHFKSELDENTLIDNCESHSAVIQGLIASGEDIYSDEWTKLDKYGNKINLVDALLSLKVGDKFKPTPSVPYPRAGQEAFAFAALSDLSRNRSMYYEFDQNKVKNFTIEIQKDSNELEINQGSNKELTAQVFEDGISVSNEIIWESMDDSIVKVENGIITGFKAGETQVRAKVRYYEDIYDEISIKVIKIIDKPNKIVIGDLENNLVLKGDEFKLSANIFDSNENKLEDILIQWGSSNSEIISVDESGNATVEGTGTVEITAKIINTEIEDRIQIVVFEKEEESNNTVNKFIDRIEVYYENTHFHENQGMLSAWETATFTRAEFDLKGWYAEKDHKPSYDMDLKYLGNKTDQVIISLDIGENPANYKGRNLIQEIVEEINKSDYGYAQQNYLRAVIAVDRFNEKYKDEKVSYDEKIVIDNILLAQTVEGGFKERGDSSVAINTGYALNALSRHRNVDGVEESINKALEYLQSIQKDNGAFYENIYVTGNNVEVIRGLLSIGEDLDNSKWTRGDMNPVESMFVLWNDEGFFDNQLGESENNRGWIPATQKSLYTLIDLKEAGYSNYIVRSKMAPDTPEEETPFEFDETTGTVTGYKDGNPPTDLVIPAEINGVAVKVIGQNAFRNKNLESVVLPEGLEKLEYMAFQENEIAEITLPSTLSTLGEGALAYNDLKTIEFPVSLKAIGKTSLMKNKIEEIEIPPHIEEIGEGAFNSNLLTNVILNEGLKILGNKAFENNSIEEITIPNTVEEWPTKKDNPIFRRNNKDINNKGDLILAKVYNSSGATAKNTFGIVNPASVTIEYKDSNGVEVKDRKIVVGKEIKKAKKDGTAWNSPIIAVEGSGEDILNYDAEFGYNLVHVLDEISENYYKIGEKYTFEALEIEDYIMPEVKEITLNDKENTITFIYLKEEEEPSENESEPEVEEMKVGVSILVFNEDGTYIIQDEPTIKTIDLDRHDGGFTAFGALQVTTNQYEASGGWVTSIYGITGPSTGTGGWMFTLNGDIPNVGASQVKLKEGDKVIWFCTYDYKRDTAPTWEYLTEEVPEEKLNIKIKTDKISIQVGEKLPLAAQVKKGDTILTDKKIMWLSSNAEIATVDEKGKLTAHKSGQVKITASLVEDKSVKDTININVAAEDEEDLTIEKALKELRGYYSKKDKFTFRSALGYNYTSDNLEKDLIEISSKFQTNENPDSASAHVGNIMGLIAAAQDPYNHKDKDNVAPLVNSQNEDGKFIIGQSDDYPTTQAFSVLALDMAKANYNKDKAIEALLGYQNETGSFGGVDETGMVLGALAKYKGKSEVQTSIDKGLSFLKGEQDKDTGGFIVWGSENPYSASAVLQGLISIGQDPMSEEWTKNGKTIVDSLLSFYKDGYFENVSEYGTEIDSITEQGFIALADVYKGKSMFNELKFNSNQVVRIIIEKPNIDKIIEGDTIKLYANGYDSDEVIVPINNILWTSSDEDIATMDQDGNLETKKTGKINITAKIQDTDIEDSIEIEVLEKEFKIEYIGNVSVQKGRQADAKLSIKNLTSDKKPALLIIGLYEKNTDRLINYSTISKTLESKEEIELSAGFLVPNQGEHYIKAFVWENFETQNIIMKDSQNIEVAN